MPKFKEMATSNEYYEKVNDLVDGIQDPVLFRIVFPYFFGVNLTTTGGLAKMSRQAATERANRFIFRQTGYRSISKYRKYLWETYLTKRK